ETSTFHQLSAGNSGSGFGSAPPSVDTAASTATQNGTNPSVTSSRRTAREGQRPDHRRSAQERLHSLNGCHRTGLETADPSLIAREPLTDAGCPRRGSGPPSPPAAS